MWRSRDYSPLAHTRGHGGVFAMDSPGTVSLDTTHVHWDDVEFRRLHASTHASSVSWRVTQTIYPDTHTHTHTHTTPRPPGRHSRRRAGRGLWQFDQCGGSQRARTKSHQTANSTADINSLLYILARARATRRSTVSPVEVQFPGGTAQEHAERDGTCIYEYRILKS